MKRYPHTLRRDGLFSGGWTLKGPVITGRFTPPTRYAPGQYHSLLLRIRYEPVQDRRVVLRFQTPRLARGGHRLMGEARVAGGERGVEVRSTVADEPPLRLAAKKGGLFRRALRLVRADGVIVATMRREGERFDVDLNAEACRWSAAPEDVAGMRTRRLLESALAMFLAALVEDVRRDMVPERPREPRTRREMAEVVTRLLRRRGSTGREDDDAKKASSSNGPGAQGAAPASDVPVDEGTMDPRGRGGAFGRAS